MVADWYSLAAIDGKESIPEAEKNSALPSAAAISFRTGSLMSSIIENRL